MGPNGPLGDNNTYNLVNIQNPAGLDWVALNSKIQPKPKLEVRHCMAWGLAAGGAWVEALLLLLREPQVVWPRFCLPRLPPLAVAALLNHFCMKHNASTKNALKQLGWSYEVLPG